MIHYTQGNLLDSDAEALVNTVNTVGVMGKGIALMFKEAFPDNFRLYAEACRRGEVEVGKMFVTERHSLTGPRWIINFPTKKHWRNRTRVEWIDEGLADLRRVVRDHGIRSIALPPLGCGNGGLDWSDVRPRLERELSDLEGVEILVYEPTRRYQNVAKRRGVEELTPARALIAELVRKYSVLGFDCSLLEVQKLAYFLERKLCELGLDNPLDLGFEPNRYGPYADRLRHLLDRLDGSYLQSEVRIADARPGSLVSFRREKRERVELYLCTEAREYLPALDATSNLIDGFESPLGLELLATVDWLLHRERVAPDVPSLRRSLANWPGGSSAGERKLRLFDERLLTIALDRLAA